jgi:isopentenyl-diphosphate delta-isomerase
MAIQEHVVLVDEMDNEIGTMEKMEAHLQPNLHRAFSVFIFNENGEMLLQQRAFEKYHSGGLWTNACCSHPKKNEPILNAAHRRLMEEMGFDTKLNKVFDFIYQASFANGLTEYEFDHVFIGNYDGDIIINPFEVANYCFKSIAELNYEIINNPDIYTEWFKIALPKLEAYLNVKREK